MKTKRLLTFTLSMLLLSGMITGCVQSAKEEPPVTQEQHEVTATPEQPALPVQRPKLSVISIKGPTGMGMVRLMDLNKKGETGVDYTFTLAAAPDEVGAKLINGEVDIAALPINLAATLYNKMQGKLKLIALNTLGVLYIVENGNTLTNMRDLEGKTLYATGQGATPEFILNYLLQQNGLADKVMVEYMNDHTELGTLAAVGEVKLAMLPEPQVTAAVLKNPDLRIALNLTEEWDKVAGGTKLVQGCIVVRSETLQNSPESVSLFLEEYAKSAEFAKRQLDETAKLIVEYEIMAAEAAAKKALPNANIVCITGDDMKANAAAMFEVLFQADPKSIGGALPGDDFYYMP